MKRLLYIAIPVTLLSCQSQPDLEELVQDMVVQTYYDNSVDFSVFSTYALTLDTIALISNTTSKTALVSEYSEMVTKTVKENLDNGNYQRVEDSQSPDFGVNVFLVDDLSIFQTVSYPGYYYNYPGYYYGGYNGYGNYYYVQNYISRTAVMVIEIADLNRLDSQQRPVVIWTANIGDAITSVDYYTKMEEAIDQAFLQSAYLKK